MDPNPAPGPDQLPLALSVGFTGHRVIEDASEARRLIAEALAGVAEAFRRAAGSEAAQAYGPGRTLRLLVGAAPGTDRLAAAAWDAAALGESHAVYPFRDAAGAAFTDDPAKGEADTRVGEPPAAGAWTGFDAASLGLAGEQAHAEVGRWIVRHADVLVAWWNGKPGKGAGGVNDTLRRALERELPVVWIFPGRAPVRLIDPALIHHHADAAEAVSGLDGIAAPFDAGALAALLATALRPPGDPHQASDAETAARLDYDRRDPLPHRPTLFGAVQRLFDRTVWRAHRWFERVASGVPPASAEPSRTAQAAEAQPGFRRLRAESREAGERAGYLASIHRSEQLLLIGIAVLAVFVGALPAMMPDERFPNFHVVAASTEFLLGALALGVSWLAWRAQRHRRWSDARRLAERLRVACATWPLGFDVADIHADPAPNWTEWRARALIRAVGPARGWVTRASFDDALAAAAARLIDSQVAYHGRQHLVAERIERSVRRVEGGAFAVLIGTLVSFLALSAVAALTGWKAPQWFGGLVTLVSAVSPAVGAGCLALEATNSFEELAEHSRLVQGEFEKLRVRLGDPAAAPYHQALATIRRSAQLLVEDADAWRDRLLRRRIVRGG
ncbi:MAG TPA: hypothetical protein VGG29_16220 [Caulobacteraceae bacterium]|jgi:hypothetical protein